MSSVDSLRIHLLCSTCSHSPKQQLIFCILQILNDSCVDLQELHGLKAIVMYLHELPPHKKNVPELINSPINLITDVRDLVHAHCQDIPALSVTGRAVLRPPSDGTLVSRG